jgi:putative transposase
MTVDLYPLPVLLVTLSGWVNRHQQHVIEYLLEENRALKGQVRGRRLRLTDDQRRCLAAKGRRLGPKRPGRPGIMQEISSLILRMSTENPAWGYTRIQGAPKNLGHVVARSTVAKVLKATGLSPAPDRPSSWRTFLRAHWGEIAGADFFTSEVWTPRGLVTYYTLFVIDLRSRRVHVVGSTPSPDTWFMAQAARRLTDAVDGFLAGHRVLICDRDSKWTDGFRRIVQGAGVRIVLTPIQAPNANAYAERFVRSIRAQCLDRLILFGERRLFRALDEFVAHYHGERNHQGLGNELITPAAAAAGGTQVQCRDRLGGLLRYYHRAA